MRTIHSESLRISAFPKPSFANRFAKPATSSLRSTSSNFKFDAGRGADRADQQVKDRPGAGRSPRGGAVRARGEHYVRGAGDPLRLNAAGIHRGAVFRRVRRGDNIAPKDRGLTDQSVALIVNATPRPPASALLSGPLAARRGYATTRRPRARGPASRSARSPNVNPWRSVAPWKRAPRASCQHSRETIIPARVHGSKTRCCAGKKS